MFFRDRKGANEPRVLSLPLLPLRDLVVFPHMVVPLIVGRPRSRAALLAAHKGDKEIFLAARERGRPTMSGTTMWGKTTRSRSGSSGRLSTRGSLAPLRSRKNMLPPPFKPTQRRSRTPGWGRACAAPPPR
jgi:ATP-dependent protease La (LON) substrate-binding domain